jgi:hypothetical protein
VPRLDLPPAIRERLLVEIYKQADELDWELLGNGLKTDQYRKWIEDERVGGVLLSFHQEKDVRVWIKDVPMKEYGRSQEGIGNYVRYVPRRYRGADEIVHAAFGPGWEVVPDSLDEKPNHCYATDGETERYVCWGRAASFRDLVWAALNQAVRSDRRPAIVITTRNGEHIAGVDCEYQKLIAEHCGVDLKHLHRSMIPNPDYVG